MSRNRITSKRKPVVSSNRVRNRISDREQGIVRNELSTSMNLFMARSSLIKGLFDGKRDIDKECGYPTSLNEFNFRDMYEREGIATRVVNIFPDECWVMDPEITENEEPELTVFEKAFEELNTRCSLFHYWHRVDQLSGIGSFGILFIAFSDGKDLSAPVRGITTGGDQAPLPPGTPPLKVLFFRCFDQTQVKIKSFESGNNPRNGQPTMYSVNFFDPASDNLTTAESKAVWTDVHWTRVIHVADNRGSNENYGRPRMKNTFNRLWDLRKILSGSGEMYWKGAFPGYAFEVNPDIASDADPIDKDSIRNEFEQYSNGLQRYLAITGVTAKSLAPQVSDPTMHVDAQILAISISISAPKRMFMGSEEARVSSQEDAKNWNKKLAKRQNQYLTPMLIRTTINRLTIVRALPTPGNTLNVHWPDLNTMTDTDKSKIAVERATALVQYVSGMVESLVAPREFLSRVLGYSLAEADIIIKEAKKHLVATGGDGMTAIKAQKEAMNPKPVNPSGNAKLASKKPSKGKKKPNTQTVGVGGA